MEHSNDQRQTGGLLQKVRKKIMKSSRKVCIPQEFTKKLKIFPLKNILKKIIANTQKRKLRYATSIISIIFCSEFCNILHIICSCD